MYRSKLHSYLKELILKFRPFDSTVVDLFNSFKIKSSKINNLEFGLIYEDPLI